MAVGRVGAQEFWGVLGGNPLNFEVNDEDQNNVVVPVIDDNGVVSVTDEVGNIYNMDDESDSEGSIGLGDDDFDAEFALIIEESNQKLKELREKNEQKRLAKKWIVTKLNMTAKLCLLPLFSMTLAYNDGVPLPLLPVVGIGTAYVATKIRLPAHTLLGLGTLDLIVASRPWQAKMIQSFAYGTLGIVVHYLQPPHIEDIRV